MAAIKFGALAVGIAALTPALLGVAGAAAGAGAAIGAIGAAGLIGSSGIIGAFKAANTEAAGAGKAAEDAADRVASAQEKVRDAVDQVANAHRDVADAQQGVVEAERKAADAQRDLNDSYQEATRYLRDMNDQLADAEISQERAEIALARARGDQAKTAVDPKATGLDRAEAALNVREAQQRLDEAKSRTADQRTDTAAANAKGVGNSDIVNAAHDKLSEADRGVVDARNGLVEANQRLADSNRNLADAQRDLAKAAIETGAGAGGVDKFAEAMAKLSPNARDFVTQIRALGPAWNQMKTTVQDRLFEGLGASVTQFANQNLGGLQSSLTQVAGYMNSTFKSTLSSLSGVFAQLSANGTMQQFISGIGGALSGMAPMIAGFTSAMIQMGAAVGPSMGPLFASLGQFAQTVAPALGGVGAQLAQTLTTIMPTLAQFISALATGLQPVLPVLGQLLQSMMAALIPAIPALSQSAQVIGGALATGLKLIAPLLPVIAQYLPQIIAGIIAFKGLQTLASAVTTIQQMAEALKLVKVATAAWSAVQWVLNAALNANPIGLIVIAIAALAAGIIYAYKHSETFRNIVQSVWEGIQTAISFAWNNVIKPVIDGLVQGFQWVWQKAQEMGGFVAQVWETFKNGITAAKDWVGARVGDIVNFFTGLPQRITNAVSGAWDGLKNAFKGAINWIIQAWNDFHISMHIPDSIPLIGGKGVDIETPDLPLLKAAGGAISGPGGPRDDLIPAMLSNGEYVIQAAAVSKYGVGFFDRVNARRFADGGAVTDETYGLPTGTNTGGYGSGGDIFPAWVHSLESHGVKPSTYPGHQESDRNEAGYAPNPNHLNRGIDWSGTQDAMQKFAEYLFSVAPNSPTLEQIIWQNPNTGQKIGWHGRQPDTDGSYFASDYPGHQDHVHTRFSGPLNAKPKPNPFDKNPNAIGSATDPSWSGTGVPQVDQLNQQSGRGASPEYAPDASSSGKKDYPTSFSGWAGFMAQQLIAGQVKDAFDMFGVNDSPGWLKTATDIGSTVQSNVDQQKMSGISGALVSWETPEARDKRLKAFSDKQAAEKQAQQGSAAQSTTAAPITDAAATNVQPTYDLPTPDPNAKAGVQYQQPVVPAMPTNTPEGGIAAGSPGGKEAFWAEWVKRGWTGNQWLDTLRLYNGESSWDANAQNPGSTAFGIPQFLDSTWATVGESKSPDPKVQARAAAKYIAGRPDYGNPSKAWELWQSRSPHWYHSGGEVYGHGDIPSWLEGGEYVVQREAAQANLPILESINARRPLPSIRQQAPANAGGYRDHVEYHVSTARVEDAFNEARRQENRRAMATIGRY